MKRLGYLMMLLLCAAPFKGRSQQRVDFYVTPGGDDRQDGSKGHPFASLERAREAVRQVPRDQKVTAVTVHLEAGTYASETPLTFGPADGGDAYLSVTYEGEQGVIFSGGQRLGGWTQDREGRWTARVPESLRAVGGFRQLYREGKRLDRGRFPKGDSLLTIDSISADYRVIRVKQPIDLEFTDRQVEVVILTNWNEERVYLDSIVGQTLYLHDPAAWVGHYGCAARVGMPLYLENDPGFVRRPGEWSLDNTKGILTYKAEAGEDPREEHFTVPVARKVLVVEGALSDPVRNLHFSGITFSYAAFPLPDSGYRGLQAGYYGYRYLQPPVYMEPSAVDFTYATDCGLEDCVVTHVGAGGVGVGEGCRRVSVLSTEVWDAGGNGISVGQRNGRLEQHYQDWASPEQAPDNTLLYNNYIHHCAATQFGDVGIFAAFCSNTRIVHNTVAHLPYTGISLGFIWDTVPTTMRACSVAFNDVHDVMRLLADGGALYTLGREPGSVIEGNLLHDVHRSSSAFGGAPNNAIFFDECSKGFYVTGNMSFNIQAGSPFRFNRNGTKDHTWGPNDFGLGAPGKDFPWDRAARTGSTLAPDAGIMNGADAAGGAKTPAADVAIPYGTGEWDRDSLGDQRVVIDVSVDADAVRVHIPWRRHDIDPESKRLILVDGASGRPVQNVYPLTVNEEYANLIFEPTTGKGTYYLYYLPFRTKGSWFFPNTIYLKPTDGWDATWLGRTDTSHLPEARVKAFEAIDDFNSFYPMEVAATERETDSIVRANADKDFLVFPEDRRFPIRMRDRLPYRWIRAGVPERFEGMAERGEFYVYQLGLYAATQELDGVDLTFSDLVSAAGDTIPVRAMRCFNLGGRDWLGNAFSKTVSVPKGRVQAMWIGIDLGPDVRPGWYSGTVTVGARGLRPRRVRVTLRIRNELIPDRGYDDLFREARLNWLDSGIGLDDSVPRPYTPVEVSDHTISVLGRSLRFDRSGFPDRITTTFTNDNQSIDGTPTEVLAAPMRFSVVEGGKEVAFRGDEAQVRSRDQGQATWTSTERSGNLRMEVRARMECDGYVNYYVTLKANREMHLDDVRLSIPYARAVAQYMMGLGRKGGYRPASWDWKWEQDRANNMVWIGNVHAGLQCKLKNITPSWNLYQFDKSGPYRDWSNGGKGGAALREHGDAFMFTAFTGARDMHAGDTLEFNFGLLITPLKTLDPGHWVNRYFQSDPPVQPWIGQARKAGADIINVHQGNSLNPYINYPFGAVDALRKFVGAANQYGIRTKIYYTIRELSNHTTEIWALRSLNHEIFTQGANPDLADQFQASATGDYKMTTGGSWLVEHLQNDYDPAWHTPLDNGKWDMAIHTQGLSRWHNYYLAGLDWMIRKVGVRGLYLDGVGYDREIMKRVRKVMDRAADSCLIDFHSGCNFEPPYGMNSAANEYMELFPYINSLWLGEGYDYNETPDYYLVEVSGIPFGLYGEMLNGCGNAYRGMVYGMTSRPGWTGCDPSGIWKLWDSFGIKDARLNGYWDPEVPVRSLDTSVRVTVYRRPGRVLLAYASWAPEDRTVALQVDWAALGMDPGSVRISAPQVDAFQDGKELRVEDLGRLPVQAGEGGILIIETKRP